MRAGAMLRYSFGFWKTRQDALTPLVGHLRKYLSNLEGTWKEEMEAAVARSSW